ncbi:hypothetical protein [Treponema denticola]|uniref:hypothetical protein n=1 Tax=Treponema denticola TaxID=158 RepID=UPI003D8D4849
MNVKVLADGILDQIKDMESVEDVEKKYKETLIFLKAGKTEDEVEDFLSSLEDLTKEYTKVLDNDLILEKLDESQAASKTNENVKKLLELIQQTKKELGLV